ncbi:hypothetical protein KM043_014881 [Ampulex compressa]|nr:hypothetical protein KM043_014881 [Ampulex compressa]
MKKVRAEEYWEKEGGDDRMNKVELRNIWDEEKEEVVEQVEAVKSQQEEEEEEEEEEGKVTRRIAVAISEAHKFRGTAEPAELHVLSRAVDELYRY